MYIAALSKTCTWIGQQFTAAGLCISSSYPEYKNGHLSKQWVGLTKVICVVSNAPTNKLVCTKAPVKTSTEFTSSTHYLAVVQVPLCTVPESHGAKLNPEEDKFNKGSQNNSKEI